VKSNYTQSLEDEYIYAWECYYKTYKETGQVINIYSDVVISVWYSMLPITIGEYTDLMAKLKRIKKEIDCANISPLS
jgi:hypothetical protein